MFTTLMSVEQLAECSDPLIIDCRFNLGDVQYGERSYLEGHIPGAYYLHLDHHLSSPVAPHTGRHPLPDLTKLGWHLQQLGLSEKRQVVVYDDAGGTVAARAWWLIRMLGHQPVALLDGGFPAWQARFPDQLEERIPATAASAEDISLEPVSLMDAVVTSEQLEQLLQQRTYLLVDARAAERFRGEVEPIDPVPGHVPGAINRPFNNNLQDGLFKSADILAEEWQAMLGKYRPDQVIHMCGSGVTACHNLLAMEHAGLTGAKLYAGSWSEWIRSPSRPVVTN
ncbi:sulfurtransferase [Nitrincola sp. MINF-07-Sa-05]|uniref:sulfurtransferase n=1 Tax=Nitrincola salilacus TaxID=3400273 RepID=UPI00391848D2